MSDDSHVHGRFKTSQREYRAMNNRNWLLKFPENAPQFRKTSCFIFDPLFKPRIVCYNFLNSKLYELMLTLVIAGYCVVLLLEASAEKETDDDGRVVRPAFTQVTDIVFLIVFFFEMVAKVVAFGLVFHAGAYLRSHWGIFELLSVVASLISVIADQSGSVPAEAVLSLRVVTYMRSVELFLVIMDVYTSSMEAIWTAAQAVAPFSSVVVTFTAVAYALLFGPNRVLDTTTTSIADATEASFMAIVQFMMNDLSANETLEPRAPAVILSSLAALSGIVVVLLLIAFAWGAWRMTRRRQRDSERSRRDIEDVFPDGSPFAINRKSVAEVSVKPEDVPQKRGLSENAIKCRRMVGGKRSRRMTPFLAVVSIITVANVLIMIARHQDEPSALAIAAIVADALFITIAVAEAVLTIVGFRLREIVLSPPRVFDFVCLAEAIADVILFHQFGSEVLKPFNPMRALKLIKHAPLLERGLSAILDSTNTILMSAFLYFGATVGGSFLFKSHSPLYSSFGTSSVVTLATMSNDQWGTIAQSVGTATGTRWSYAYFVAVAGIMHFVLLRYFIVTLLPRSLKVYSVVEGEQAAPLPEGTEKEIEPLPDFTSDADKGAEEGHTDGQTPALLSPGGQGQEISLHTRMRKRRRKSRLPNGQPDDEEDGAAAPGITKLPLSGIGLSAALPTPRPMSSRFGGASPRVPVPKSARGGPGSPRGEVLLTARGERIQTLSNEPAAPQSSLWNPMQTLRGVGRMDLTRAGWAAARRQHREEQQRQTEAVESAVVAEAENRTQSNPTKSVDLDATVRGVGFGMTVSTFSTNAASKTVNVLKSIGNFGRNIFGPLRNQARKSEPSLSEATSLDSSLKSEPAIPTPSPRAAEDSPSRDSFASDVASEDSTSEEEPTAAGDTAVSDKESEVATETSDAFGTSTAVSSEVPTDEDATEVAPTPRSSSSASTEVTTDEEIPESDATTPREAAANEPFGSESADASHRQTTEPRPSHERKEDTSSHFAPVTTSFSFPVEQIVSPTDAMEDTMDSSTNVDETEALNMLLGDSLAAPLTNNMSANDVEDLDPAIATQLQIILYRKKLAEWPIFGCSVAMVFVASVVAGSNEGAAAVALALIFDAIAAVLIGIQGATPGAYEHIGFMLADALLWLVHVVFLFGLTAGSRWAAVGAIAALRGFVCCSVCRRLLLALGRGAFFLIPTFAATLVFLASGLYLWREDDNSHCDVDLGNATTIGTVYCRSGFGNAGRGVRTLAGIMALDGSFDSSFVAAEKVSIDHLVFVIIFLLVFTVLACKLFGDLATSFAHVNAGDEVPVLIDAVTDFAFVPRRQRPRAKKHDPFLRKIAYFPFSHELRALLVVCATVLQLWGVTEVPLSNALGSIEILSLPGHFLLLGPLVAAQRGIKNYVVACDVLGFILNCLAIPMLAMDEPYPWLYVLFQCRMIRLARLTDFDGSRVMFLAMRGSLLRLAQLASVVVGCSLAFGYLLSETVSSGFENSPGSTLTLGFRLLLGTGWHGAFVAIRDEGDEIAATAICGSFLVLVVLPVWASALGILLQHASPVVEGMLGLDRGQHFSAFVKAWADFDTEHAGRIAVRWLPQLLARGTPPFGTFRVQDFPFVCFDALIDTKTGEVGFGDCVKAMSQIVSSEAIFSFKGVEWSTVEISMRRRYPQLFTEKINLRIEDDDDEFHSDAHDVDPEVDDMEPWEVAYRERCWPLRTVEGWFMAREIQRIWRGFMARRKVEGEKLAVSMNRQALTLLRSS